MLTGYHNRLALYECVALVTTSASTVWSMIDHIAYGVEAACTGAGIDATFISTSSDVRTIGIAHTFRTTIRRISEIVWQTITHGQTILFIATGELSAWRRYTRVRYYIVTLDR